MARNLQPPPSAISGPLGTWLKDLHKWVEGQAQVSLASFGPNDTPNSRVTGLSGTIAVNVGGGSNQTRLWVLGGDNLSTHTDQGWSSVRVLQ